MKLIIVQGESTTGKTTLVKKLATDLKLSYFMKDEYKEHRYDELGHIPTLKEWKTIDVASWEQIYEAVRRTAKEDKTLIIEGNFWKSKCRVLREIIPTDATVIEIFCTAAPSVIFRRFRNRYRSGERHPSHRDHLWLPAVGVDMLCAKLGWHWIQPVGVSETMIRVDSTDFSKVDYEAIKKFVSDNLR